MKVNFGRIEQLAERNGTSLSQLSQQMGRNRFFLYNARTAGGMKFPDVEALAKLLGTTWEDISEEPEKVTKPLPSFANASTATDISVLEFADMLATRPQTQVLFSALKNASDEDIAKVISILKVLKGENDAQ